MSLRIPFDTHLQASRRWIDEELVVWQKEQQWSSDFSEALNHVLRGAGKAFRPALAFWTSKIFTLESDTAKPSHSLRRVGLALELMHTYSLVHDDLPAMDNDSFRRGRPTLHTMKGDAFAILAGDALLTASFGVLAEAFVSEPEKLPAAISILAKAGGAQGMIEGQWRDICAEGITSATLQDLESIHDLKTGALLGASVALGALHALPLSQFRTCEAQVFSWGVGVGRLFQMVDDYLDVTGSTGSLGKTAGKDEQQGKLTYPALVGLEACLKHIQNLQRDLLDSTPWQAPSDTQALLNFVSQRVS